jgi:hypothetical protein
MDDEDEARAWRTAAVPFGCLGALAFSLIVGAVFMLGMTMGDCVSGEDCRRGDGFILLGGFAIIAVVALVYGALWSIVIRALWPPLARRIGNAFGILLVGPITVAAGLVIGWQALDFLFDHLLLPLASWSDAARSG